MSKKPKRMRRTLSEAQRVIVAKELFQEGKSIKQTAADWHVSQSNVVSIFHEHIGWLMFWKKTCTKSQMCTYPLCNCKIDTY